MDSSVSRENNRLPINHDEVTFLQVEETIREDVRKDIVNRKKYFFRTENNSTITCEVLVSDEKQVRGLDNFVADARKSIKIKRERRK